MRRLAVWWDERIVGELIQDKSGDIGFTYDPKWLADPNALALSASLPKRSEKFKRRECRPFFAGLLPDEDQRTVAAEALGVSKVNDFALLDRLGGDVAGAIQLLSAGEKPAAASKQQTQALSDEELIATLDKLPTQPMLAGEGELRLSLAGAQSKLPVVLVNGAIALPLPGQATTHILKPPIARYPATTENEAYAMTLAKAIGLNVANVEARLVKDRPFLLVERYDRELLPDGSVKRIHQEDFCQAMGIAPETKYAIEGGPTLKDCFPLLLRESTIPVIDRLRLMDAVIFNIIIGNADAHGKNFSLLRNPGSSRLTPLYDLLSTVMYPKLSQKFAMKIGGASTIQELNAKTWAKLSADTEIGQPYIRRRLGEIHRAVMSKADEVAILLSQPGFDADALTAQADLVKGRAERILEGLQ